MCTKYVDTCDLSQHQVVEKNPANTNLEHLSRLSLSHKPSCNTHVRKTGIICTIGLIISFFCSKILSNFRACLSFC